MSFQSREPASAARGEGVGEGGGRVRQPMIHGTRIEGD